MSIEQAILARAGSYALAEKTRGFLREEINKGCRPEIAPEPVALEPVYLPILRVPPHPDSDPPRLWNIEEALPHEQQIRLRVWISPQQACDFQRSELCLKQLTGLGHRAAWEILGNKEQIMVQWLCHQDDLPVVQAAFSGQFEVCALSRSPGGRFAEVPECAWRSAIFRDFYPSPPYSHLLTCPDELHRSPYATLLVTLAALKPPALGFYQVVFYPTQPGHDWHQNVQTLVDLEYALKLIGSLASPLRYAQQVPSGDLRQMAQDTATKAHNDKPFFAVAFRIGIVEAPEPSGQFLRAMSTMAGLFQHGGRPLNSLGREQYDQQLDPERLQGIFTQGLTYRSGFLLNSWELASLIHLPPPEFMAQLKDEFPGLDSLPVDAALTTGTPIGSCQYADEVLPICIPDNLRVNHVHLIGRPGQGKSSVLEAMILHDLRREHGVAVLDPHGSLIQRLLCLMPPEYADRVIYLDPGDPEWVPIWNPLCSTSGQNCARAADELVSAFKSVVTGWGDRLEHLFRHAFFALLHLPDASLLDMANLLRQKSPESRQLRRRLLSVLDNEVARQFWREDFDRYTAADLFPPQHKLSKLLVGETAALMLSQRESLFHLREVMDYNKILLVNLAHVGPGTLEILGCFLLSLLHLTALGRGTAAPPSGRRFHIYCDEAHRFLTDAVEDLIVEMRKFNVSLTLAHQFLRQFNPQQSDALGSIGSTIIFNVDTKDASQLLKDLQGKVILEDMITLQVGQAIARIGDQVVRLKTPLPPEIPAQNRAEDFIRHSHQRYYRPTEVVKQAIRRGKDAWAEPIADMPDGEPPSSGAGQGPEELMYDEL